MSLSTARELLAALDPQALAAIVASAVGIERVQTANCHLHRAIPGCQGYNGLTCILSVQYSSTTRIGWIDLVLKWPKWPSLEYCWYPALMNAGAPVPRLEGTISLGQAAGERPDSVLVLEYLPHIGWGPGDAHALARTLGRFHALAPSLFPELPIIRYQDELPGWTQTWHRLHMHARSGDLGAAIQAFVEREERFWPRMDGHLASLTRSADALASGVVHRDVSRQNTGWRQGSSELLLFDVQRMAHGCLVGDVLALCTDIDGGEQELDTAVADSYREALRAHGGPALSLADMRQGLAILRPLHRIAFLLGTGMWRSIDGQVDWTTDIEEGRRSYRAGTLSSLEQIISSLRSLPADA